jgi:hypothetical protein
MCLITSFIHKNVHFRFLSITKSRSSSVNSSKAFVGPTHALFTKISILPKFLIVVLTRFLMSSELETSHFTAIAFQPKSSISCTTFVQFSSFVLETTTVAQFFASSKAVAFQIPLLEPVTMATLSLNFILLFFLRINITTDIITYKNK